MTESENLEVVKRAYAALDADDVDTFLEACAPDIEWVYPPTEELPYGGLWSGQEGVLGFLEAHEEAEEILELTPTDFIGQGDRVVVLGHFRGKTKPAGVKARTVWPG